MTTVDQLFAINSNFSFNGGNWSSSAGNIGWTDQSADRHHINPTPVANQLAVFRDLAQIKDSGNRSYYDHWDFHANGARLPTDVSQAQQLLRSSNLSSHVGYQSSLSGQNWYGKTNQDWIDFKADLDARLSFGAVTPEAAMGELHARAAEFRAEIRGIQAYLQSRTYVQIDTNDVRINPLDLQAPGGADPLAGITKDSIKGTTEYRLAADHGINISGRSDLYELPANATPQSMEIQLRRRTDFLRDAQTALDDGTVPDFVNKHAHLLSSGGGMVGSMRAGRIAADLIREPPPLVLALVAALPVGVLLSKEADARGYASDDPDRLFKTLGDLAGDANITKEQLTQFLAGAGVEAGVSAGLGLTPLAPVVLVRHAFSLLMNGEDAIGIIKLYEAAWPSDPAVKALADAARGLENTSAWQAYKAGVGALESVVATTLELILNPPTTGSVFPPILDVMLPDYSPGDTTTGIHVVDGAIIFNGRGGDGQPFNVYQSRTPQGTTVAERYLAPGAGHPGLMLARTVVDPASQTIQTTYLNPVYLAGVQAADAEAAAATSGFTIDPASQQAYGLGTNYTVVHDLGTGQLDHARVTRANGTIAAERTFSYEEDMLNGGTVGAGTLVTRVTATQTNFDAFGNVISTGVGVRSYEAEDFTATQVRTGQDGTGNATWDTRITIDAPDAGAAGVDPSLDNIDNTGGSDSFESDRPGHTDAVGGSGSGAAPRTAASGGTASGNGSQTVVQPERTLISFSQIGSALGSSLGQLIGGRNPAGRVVASSALATVLSGIGGQFDTLVGLSDGSPQIFDKLTGTFTTATNLPAAFAANLRNETIGAVTSYLTAELAESLGVRTDSFKESGTATISGRPGRGAGVTGGSPDRRGAMGGGRRRGRGPPRGRHHAAPPAGLEERRRRAAGRRAGCGWATEGPTERLPALGGRGHRAVRWRGGDGEGFEGEGVP